MLPTHLPTASLLVANMHCPSCVESISALAGDIPGVVNLSVSLLLHRVTFAVDTSISSSSRPGSVDRVIDSVKRVLTTEGGFVVTNENEEDKPVKEKKWFTHRREKKENKVADERRRRHLERCEACRLEMEAEKKGLAPPTLPTPAPPDQVSITTLSIDGMTCASCTSTITAAVKTHPSVIDVNINLLSSSGVIRHKASLAPAELVEIIDDTGFEAEVIESHPAAPEEEEDALVRTTLSIQGMTCASCSSAIDRALKQLPDVVESSIDVLGNKGVVTHKAHLTAETIKETIEDVGYDAEIVSSISSEKKSEQGLRTVTIRVEGTFCNNCIKQLNEHLETMPLKSFTPLSLSSPVTTVTYTPHAPLTIRDILKSLSDVAPEFDAEIARVQSLSERSREIQRREVKILASHLAVAIVFAIPTFIIGIVAMVILPSSNGFRKYWHVPAWGGANRATLALWALASIVQFGVGWLFYKRALNSLLPILRSFVPSFLLAHRTTRAPRKFTWKSFFSFGSMDLLVSLSTTVSYFASVAMMILDIKAGPGAMSMGTYFDSSVFIIMFILLGRTLEAYAKSRTTDAVALLGTLRPDTAFLVSDSEKALEASDSESDSGHANGNGEANGNGGHSSNTQEIPIDQVEYGDILLVHPGALPPTDGVIVHGSTTFDESSLTGESLPVSKSPGDEVFTGTTNQSSAVTIRVTSLAGDTMLERIIRAVSDASGRKAPLERVAERLTGVFVPIVVYIALAVLAIWLGVVFGGLIDPSRYHGSGGRAFFAIEFAVAVLVVACPCGIGLAVPCANAVGNGLAAAAGILASGGGTAFTNATKVTTIAFDKTGTLTVGKSVVTDEYYLGANEEEIAAATKAVEGLSTHPLATGLVDYLTTSLPVSILESAEIAGRGIRASVSIRETQLEVLVGNQALLVENGVSLPTEAEERIDTWSNDAKSIVLVASRPLHPPSGPSASSSAQFSLVGMYALSDPPRETTSAVLAQLKEKGYDLVMLSGDNIATARAVARMVGIDAENVHAGVGPEGKAAAIADMQSKLRPASLGLFKFRKPKETRHVVMFVGDGLNDAVALAAADTSAAMGHGSQATLASADFVLLSSNLDSLVTLLHLSRKVRNRQYFNLFWAMIFNVVCIPIAAGILWPAGGIRLSPVWSAVLMACSSVSVVLSSLALRWGL